VVLNVANKMYIVNLLGIMKLALDTNPIIQSRAVKYQRVVLVIALA
jgi:hypothetical protein